jgi:anti-sigma factor ChrR (cupin superfamily)
MDGETDVLPVRVDVVEPVEVGPGCLRRDLPSTGPVRVWVVDMEPGSRWPHIDVHDAAGEEVYVAAGEVIEGERRFGAGTYLHFAPHSCHRPRTETGARLFGFNLVVGIAR